jgi:hypothetical protein
LANAMARKSLPLFPFFLSFSLSTSILVFVVVFLPLIFISICW